MTPEERIAAIRERLEAAAPGPWSACGADQGGCKCGMVWCDEHDMPVGNAWNTEHMDGEGYRLEQQFKNATFIANAPTDIAFILTYTAALRDVAEAAEGMPEPLFSDIEASNICTYCSDLDSRHAPDCPWLLLQAALQRVAEVRG